jgi:HEPN domain-containing protein
MDVAKTVAYWTESAAYDLETGRTLLAGARYPYALFFGHLALEKLLKAQFVRLTGQHAPLTHSLPLLASKSGIVFPDEIMDRLAEFMEFHIESRYPDASLEFYRKCTATFSRAKFGLIEDTYLWLTKHSES